MAPSATPPSLQETDGFQVKRPGDVAVRCTILLLLDYQPLQFKLDQRLARLLGVHTQTRPVIISALWQYIKTHKLQDQHEKEFVNCDPFLKQIFQTDRMKFAEIPQRLNPLLHPPDPIVINHVISVEELRQAETKKTACYDIDVEVDDTLKTQMNNFLLSTASQQEIQSLDNKIHETVETINSLKTSREFFLSFAKVGQDLHCPYSPYSPYSPNSLLLSPQDPQLFINKWLQSQTRDIKTMTDVTGNPEEERRVDYYYQPWVTEGVCRWVLLTPSLTHSHPLLLQLLLRQDPAEARRAGLQPGSQELLRLWRGGGEVAGVREVAGVGSDPRSILYCTVLYRSHSN